MHLTMTAIFKLANLFQGHGFTMALHDNNMSTVVGYKSSLETIGYNVSIYLHMFPYEFAAGLRSHCALYFHLLRIPGPFLIFTAARNARFLTNTFKCNVSSWSLLSLKAYPLITPVPAQQVWLAPPKEAVTYHGPPFCFKKNYLSSVVFSSFSSLKAQSVFQHCPFSAERRCIGLKEKIEMRKVIRRLSLSPLIQVPPWLSLEIRKGTAAVSPELTVRLRAILNGASVSPVSVCAVLCCAVTFT